MNRRANQLARHLCRRGVGAETRVGLLVERSFEMVVGLLGILKAGGAYVPLDPAYPHERLAFMLKDTAASLVLTTHATEAGFDSPGFDFVRLDADWPLIAREAADNLDAETSADRLAYVAYTSGSTGEPKGVAVVHRAVVRLVRQDAYASFDADETFVQFAPLAFDASTFEIWGSLLNGARLVVMPPGRVSLAELGDALRQHRVTTLWLTAGLFHLMVDEQLPDLAGLRQLLAGGDVLSAAHVGKFLAAAGGCTLVNGYGPTENTTFTCCRVMHAPFDAFGEWRKVENGATRLMNAYETSETTITSIVYEASGKMEEQGTGGSLPIGRALANTEVYALDSGMEPVGAMLDGDAPRSDMDSGHHVCRHAGRLVVCRGDQRPVRG